jgi:Methylamine utilisation protein MauE
VELIGPYLVAAGLLVVAGLAKAIRPDDTARALSTLAGGARAGRAIPLRVTRAAVRAGALGEAALGLAALAAPRPVTAAFVALSYTAFAAVVALAWWRGGPLATCGCFGRPDTPPTAVHLLLDVALAAAAVAVAVTAPASGTLPAQLAQQPWAGLPLLFVSAVALWLSLLAMSALGTLAGARRLVRTAGPGR